MASEEPNPGDLIEIFRGTYQHWAIYTGHGFVVHVSPPSEGAGANSLMSVFADAAVVKKQTLKHVVKSHKWKINNILDHKYCPRRTADIVKEALDRVGQEVPYSVFRSNCEHFVTELRYGRPESRQARDAETGLILGAGLGLVALAAVAFSGNGSTSRRSMFSPDSGTSKRPMFSPDSGTSRRSMFSADSGTSRRSMFSADSGTSRRSMFSPDSGTSRRSMFSPDSGTSRRSMFSPE